MKERIPEFPEAFESSVVEGDLALFEESREKILDSLDPVLDKTNGIDGSSGSYEKAWQSEGEDFAELIKLSAEAGEFFRGAIPHGLRKIKNEDVPNFGSLNPMLLEFASYGRERKEFRGEVMESKFGDKIEQKVISAWMQDGNKNLIYENIENSLYPEAKISDTHSFLIIQNIETGEMLDLNAILPRGYSYMPHAMEIVPEKDGKERQPADLKNYSMERSGANDFAAKRLAEIIEYGNLREKGAILSLFHEVAHSWQGKYYNTADMGRAGFEKFYDEITGLINKLDLSRGDEGYEEPEKIWEKLEEAGIEPLYKEGVKHPVNEDGVINIPNIYHLPIKLIKLVSSPADFADLLSECESKVRYYPVKSSKLQSYIDGYISEERDAWANAIRTIRFLRSKGFDAEPEIKNVDDFKNVIDPCLASYQNCLDASILTEKNRYRFNRVQK